MITASVWNHRREQKIAFEILRQKVLVLFPQTGVTIYIILTTYRAVYTKCIFYILDVLS